MKNLRLSKVGKHANLLTQEFTGWWSIDVEVAGKSSDPLLGIQALACETHTKNQEESNHQASNINMMMGSSRAAVREILVGICRKYEFSKKNKSLRILLLLALVKLQFKQKEEFLKIFVSISRK
jgi:hypothetical protein